MGRMILACALVLAGGAAWAQTAVPVDGVYAGGADLLGTAQGRAAQGRCDQRIAFKLRIKDRAFTWKLPTSQAAILIAPDGTFSGQNGRRVINGSIHGAHFAARTVGPGCNYIWSLDRQ